MVLVSQVCTIHQPRANILWLFNQILLLESGRTAFTGPPQEAVAFFASVGHEIPAMTNPADYLMDTLKEHGSGAAHHRSRTLCLTVALQISATHGHKGPQN